MNTIMHVVTMSDEELAQLDILLHTAAEAVRMSQITLHVEIPGTEIPGNFTPREMIMLKMTTIHLEHMASVLECLIILMAKAQSMVIQ